MNKDRQYAEYELNGGTMNIEEWEDDSRYDKSLHIDTLEKKEQQQAELILDQDKNNTALLSSLAALQETNKNLDATIKRLRQDVNAEKSNTDTQISNNELIIQQCRAQLTAITMLFDICSSAFTHNQKRLFTNQAKFIVNNQISNLKHFGLTGKFTPDDLPF